MKLKSKGTGLGIRTFRGKDGSTYLVFRTPKGAFHVFCEVNAKNAAREAFGVSEGTTMQNWGKLWKSLE